MCKKKILITGAEGFIGYYFYKKLKKKNNYDIYCTINSRKNKIKKKNFLKIKMTKNIKILRIDLKNLKKTKEAIRKINPNIIYHFAAFSDHKFSEQNKLICRKNNVLVTRNIIRSLNSNCKIVFLSTDKVYSQNQNKSHETINLKPTGYLAKQKLQCEKIIKKKTKKFFILRLPIVHRLGENYNNSIIDNFLHKLKKRQKIKVFKNIRRSFLIIADLNKLLEDLIESKKYGIYNIGSNLISYSNRVKNLCKLINLDYTNLIDEVHGNIYPFKQNFNTTKVKKKFNFKFY
jgi:nucleoside-diphosphate-sugar epimerase